MTGAAGRLAAGAGSSSATMAGEEIGAAGLLTLMGATMGLSAGMAAASSAAMTGVAGRLCV